MRDELVWLAVMIVAEAVPSRDQKQYWILQQRLLPHADRCSKCVRDTLERQPDAEIKVCQAGDAGSLHSLGSLYFDQGKLADAEAMYRRALAGYEKALGPDHASTLDTVHALGNLYRGQGKLAEAEAMDQPAQ